VTDPQYRTDSSILREAVAEAMSTSLAGHLGVVPPVDIQEVQRQIRGPEAAQVDYDAYSRAFAHAYHMVNYRKCLAALDQLAPSPTTRVLDLGTGSGAAAAAALVYLASRIPTSPAVEVRLVDRSHRQLDLASGLLERLREYLTIEFKVEATQADVVRQPLSPGFSPSLVLATHLLTENPDQVLPLLRTAESAAGAGGALIVMEREDDPIWSGISAYRQRSLAARAAGGGLVSGAGPDGVHRDWRVRWLMLEPPVRRHLEGAARRYFDAWLTREPSRLSTVFTTDARYHDKPFKDPISGLVGIEEYWRSEVLPQQDLSIIFDDVAYGPQSAHIEWRALFVRDGLQRVVQGTMMLDVEPDSGLIRELREYYRSAPPEDVCDPDRRPGSSDR
jgi:SAM-dependent methyltransferase